MLDRLRPLAVATTLTLLAPSAARSAQTDTTQAQDTIPVEPIEVVVSIAPTAGPTIGSGIPARLSTVSRQRIEAWEPRTLADALVTQAGVSFYDDLGSSYKLNLSTRGFNVGPVVGLPPGVSVFLDGVRQNEPDAAQVNFDLLPLEHVERIELLSGTGPLLGSNSLGGAVNLITRRGSGPAEGELEVSGGSFDAYSAEGSLAGAHEGWDYYLGGGYEEDGGWRAATGAENYNGFVNVGRRSGDRGFRLQGFYSESYAETAGSLPESVFRTSPKTNFTAGDFEDLSLFQVSAFGYTRVGPGRGSATVYFRSHDAERFNVNQAPDPDVRGFSENRTFGGNLDWRWSKTYGDRVFALRFGLDGALNSVDVRLLEEDTVVTLTTDVSSPSWDIASYAIADYLVGRVTFSGGLRFDYIEVPFEPRVINDSMAQPGDSATHVFRRVSPRGGVSVQLSPTAVAYGSVGQSFRAPVVLELACADPTAACPLPFALGDDPPLDPVVATTYELGARWAWGPASLDAAVYRTDVRDDIFFIASETAIFEGHFANIGDTRRQGIELGAELPLRGGHLLYGNYAYTHATFQTEGIEIFSLREEADSMSAIFGENEIEKGSRIPLVPEHQIRAGAMLALPAGLHAGVDARYTGEQWFRGDEANETSPLSGYFVADLRLEWEGAGFGVSALVTNLFDSDKAVFGTFNENRASCDPVTGECEIERFLTPLQERAFKLILRRGFGG